MKKFLLVLVLVLLFIVPVYAENEIEVVIDNIDSLQSAIDNAPVGSTLVIPEGSYNVSGIKITKDVNIVGDGDVVLNVMSLLVPFDTASSYNALMFIGGNSNDPLIDITLKNLTIQTDLNVVEKTTFGVKVAFVEGLNFKNVTINALDKSGIDIYGCKDVNLKNIKVNNATNGVGIGFSVTENVIAKNIKTSGNSWGGIGVYAYKGGSNNYNFKNLKMENKLYITHKKDDYDDFELKLDKSYNTDITEYPYKGIDYLNVDYTK